jgi:hypothetical protein
MAWGVRMNAVGWGIFAAIFAVMTPLTLLVMREVIRRRRSALLGELLDTLFKGKENVPTLEFARNKYGARATASAADQSREERAATRTLTRPYALLVSAIPYLLLSTIGFLILIEPICALISTDACFGNLIVQSLIWIEHPGSVAEAGPRLLEAAAIVGAAFLGGYLFTLRTLLRAVMNFELSPITWLRAAVHILSGSIIALLLYRTLGGTPYLSDVLQVTSTPDGEPLRLWLAVAFIAGYVPDFGLSTLVRYLHITYLKNVDDAVMKSVAIIPIEIVDGIDYDVRYRLEETNIVDIQNLATYNPILLFVETPYGLYEAFDWVLQAQLCLAVGPRTFLELKKYKVRTIFDLEKAVTGTGTDGLTRMIGAVLYTDADPQMRKCIATAGADPNAPGELDVVSVRQAITVMGDNLHTRRLRQLWSVIYGQLTPVPATPSAAG